MGAQRGYKISFFLDHFDRHRLWRHAISVAIWVRFVTVGIFSCSKTIKNSVEVALPRCQLYQTVQITLAYRRSQYDPSRRQNDQSVLYDLTQNGIRHFHDGDRDQNDHHHVHFSREEAVLLRQKCFVL